MESVKGSQLGTFCPQAIVYCYLEFKLHYLKNLKLFSSRVKELFEPIVLRKKGDGFLLFLKAFSWETDLWVTLGDFAVKKPKIGKGNLYLTENRLSRNEMLCSSDNHNNMRHICAKELLDSNFNETVIDKISIFQEIAPNFTYIWKHHNFSSITGRF